MDFKIGEVFDGIYPVQAAVWCNQNKAHIEERTDGGYVIVANAPAAQATAQEKVARLEAAYQLPRPVRTALLLAREAGQSVDVKLMARVDEIEALAAGLRGGRAEPVGAMNGAQNFPPPIKGVSK